MENKKVFIIPEGVTVAKEGDLKGIEDAVSLIIPDSLTNIDILKYSVYFSYHTYNLKNITVGENNKVFSSLNGVLYNKEMDTVLYCPKEKETVNIPDSVTKIDDHAFDQCKNIVEINIPDSVTSIGRSAFFDCESLKSITIPDSVETIAPFAFCQCKNLVEVNIPDSVTSIEDSAFKDCSNLAEINIPNSVEYIGIYAFAHCRSLKSITIPEGVKAIPNSAFECCESLTSVTLPESLTVIGFCAFYFCKKLVEINIPNSVESIGHMAFSTCNSLRHLTIPDDVLHISCGYFDENKNLTVTYKGRTFSSSEFSKIKIELFDYYGDSDWSSAIKQSDLDSIKDAVSTVIPEGTTEIKRGDFNGMKDAVRIVIPSSVKKIYNGFSKCLNLKSIEVSKNNKNFSSFDGVLYNKRKDTILACPRGKEIVNIPASVTNNNEKFCKAFSKCSNLKSIKVSRDNKEFASFDGALYNRNMDTLIFCPNGKETVTIHDRMRYIHEKAFDGCLNLKSMIISENNKAFLCLDGVLYNKEMDKLINCPQGRETLTIPESVTALTMYSFKSCKKLTKIIIPESVMAIGDHAFEDCENLVEVIIPNSVRYIGEYAFKNCKSLTSIDIPESVKIIYSEVFSGCKSLENINIPGVAFIRYRAFLSCKSLTSVTLPNSLTDIEDNAFESCDKITVTCKGQTFKYDELEMLYELINSQETDED